MTRRARRLLDALEDGCQTRGEIYDHAGKFFLCNNAASDLRRAGIAVDWDRATDTYALSEEDRGGTSTDTAGDVLQIVASSSLNASRLNDGGRSASEATSQAAAIVEPDRQLALI